MSEVLNRIVLKLNYCYYSFLDVFFNGINKFLASMKGVIYGTRLKTYGLMYFLRHPGSSISIGDNCEFRSRPTSNLIGINKRCIVATHAVGAKIIIGSNCGFSGVTIGCQELVIIGNNCMVGGNVIICDTDWHSLKPDERLTGKANSKPTIIEDNVFIGAGSIILKGTTIGKNSVIGAGSVLSGHIPENVIAAGNPCRVIKSL